MNLVQRILNSLHFRVEVNFFSIGLEMSLFQVYFLMGQQLWYREETENLQPEDLGFNPFSATD